MLGEVVTISSGMAYPGSHLSNLYPHRFTFDGIKCRSIESLLQSFKIEDRVLQLECCDLSPFEAKTHGKNFLWQEKQLLYWNGVSYKRDSAEYTELLRAAFTALSTNPRFAKALIATGDKMLIHPIGRKNKTQTILTANEFCNILEELRENLKRLDDV